MHNPVFVFTPVRQRRRPGAFFTLLALLLCCPTMRAQTGAGIIEGRVQDPASGDYLNNVRVRAAGRETVTDATGYFHLADLPAGDVTVRLNYLNFDQLSDVVPVVAGQLTRRDYSLTNRNRYGDGGTVVLDQYVVAATREMDAAGIATAEQRQSNNVKNVLAAGSFGDVSEGNVGEFLKLMPGVVINYAEGDASTIILRGFSPQYTGVMVDGNSIASAASSNPTRVVDLEQISIGNTSRLEVIKTVLPSQWANSLGGSVNMVSKSSFERTRSLLTARAFLQFSNDDHSFGNTPGPGSLSTPKLRPGYQVSYIKPLNKDLGFSISSSDSDQFGRRSESQATYEFNPSAGGSELAPYLRGLRLNDNARETRRKANSFGVDWRPVERLTLHLDYQYNTLNLFTAPRYLIFNTGTTPVSFDANGTNGRSGAGTAQQGSTWTTKSGETSYVALRADYRGHDWQIDTAASYSYSTNRYRTIQAGFFKNINARIPSPTITIADATHAGSVGAFEVRSGGSVIDWTRLNSYRIIDTTDNSWRDGWNENLELRANARRNFTVAGRPAAVQFGGAAKSNDRARASHRRKFTFVGADGIGNNADNAAGVVLDTGYGTHNYRYGWPNDIQWADLFKFYKLYESNPGYFVPDLADDYNLEATSDDGFKETLTAAYLQGELRLMDNRLTLVGGVRYEHTEASGYGLKIDQTAGLSFPAGSLERIKAQYIKRGGRAEDSYGDPYPSVSATFAIRDNLLVRFGYSRTLGRPEVDNLIPRITESDTNVGGYDGTLNVRNPALKPWTADNFDLSLEYYFNTGGVVSVGAFRKAVADPFASFTVPLDPALAKQLGYDSVVYSNYRMITTYNSADTSRLTGFELNYHHDVGSLLTRAKGLSIFANGTLLDYDGPREADFSDMIEKTANWGFSYLRGPITLRLNWSHTGRQKTDSYTWAPDAARYMMPMTTLDLGTEYRLTKNVWAFANARNLTNKGEVYAIYSSKSPEYSRIQTVANWGVKWSVGVRARF